MSTVGNGAEHRKIQCWAHSMRCLKPNAFPICDWCEYLCWAPFTTVFLMNAHPCFRAFCSFSMSPLSLIVADYRYQVHFSTPRFAGVSKTTRHGEYGKQGMEDSNASMISLRVHQEHRCERCPAPIFAPITDWECVLVLSTALNGPSTGF